MCINRFYTEPLYKEGRLITEKTNSNTIYVSDLASGAYFLELSQAGSINRIVEKILVDSLSAFLRIFKCWIMSDIMQPVIRIRSCMISIGNSKAT